MSRLVSQLAGDLPRALKAVRSARAAARERAWALAGEAAGSVVALGPTADGRRQLTRKLIGCMRPDTMLRLLPEIIRLTETSEERAYARREVLRFLPQVDFITAVLLIQRVMQLSPTADELRQAFDVAREVTGLQFVLEKKSDLVSEQPNFSDSHADPPAADNYSNRFRRAALELLAQCTDGTEAAGITSQASQYHLTAEEKRQCRSILLNHLGMTFTREAAEKLIHELTQLDPTSEDLAMWSTWAVPPTIKLLAAARCNSKLPEWFKLLPIPAVV